MRLSLVLIASALVVAVSAECHQDKAQFCLGWKLAGYCKRSSKHHTWMKEHCADTCDFPCPTTQPPTSGCADKNEAYCKKYALNCFRDGWKDYLKVQCPKTCKACGGAATTPQGPLPTQASGQCGVKGDGHTRIVGGTNARPGDWPWQVQIDLNTDWGRYWCGGTLINDEWIVSAAHCFEDDTRARNYDIYLGEHDIRSKSGNEQKMEVAEIIMHPGYKYGDVDNDMALIRLKKKASFNTYVRPACFPDSSVKFPSGEECYVTGWGALRTGGSSPRILQQAKIPLVPQHECQRAMGNDITKNMFCAGYANKRIDSCQGDSGGPLVCKKRTSTGQDVWYLWGVVSWGIDCASPGYYGVYSSIENMGSWVTNTLKSRRT
ncbi:trypsin-2-like [Clytia hemisphaerica]|uniref:Uncharacterized protein n=1 Tax=Clytia hemisphaerica TaxID=252671 RepID=A0A7M5WUC2_9CNID